MSNPDLRSRRLDARIQATKDLLARLQGDRIEIELARSGAGGEVPLHVSAFDARSLEHVLAQYPRELQREKHLENSSRRERLLMLLCYAVTVAAWIALFLMSHVQA